MSTSASNSTNNNEATIAQPASSIKADGVQSIAAQTTGFTFNHTMLRVKTLLNHWSFILACSV